jgi:DNA polymerase-3 subunit gamma/tau
MKGNGASTSQAATQNMHQINEPYIELNEPVTQQKLATVWTFYANKIKADNMRLYSILTSHAPQLQQENIIFVELASSMQEDELLKEKPVMMTFLKNELQNTQLELRTDVRKDDSKVPGKAFTAADKLEVMIQKNSALALLKQHFNLDLD